MKLKGKGERMPLDNDREYFALCEAEGANSDDADTKLGCILLHPNGGVVSKGHNSLPRGVQRTPVERLARPEKYAWIEHAERNAIYAAALSGTSLRGCTMYVELMPCADCARGIIQSGITEVVVSEEKMREYANSFYGESHKVARVLFEEAGVLLRFI